MFGELPKHLQHRHKPKEVPSIGAMDDVQIPVGPPQPYMEIIGPEPMQRDAVLDSSAKLDELTQKALNFYDELLSEPPSGDKMVLSAQTDAARTVLTTQLRVDDTRLRRKNTDTLSKLLARIAEEEPKLLTSA